MAKRKTFFGIPYEWFWMNGPWTVYFGSVMAAHLKWKSIKGLQFGPYFIGVIKGVVTRDTTNEKEQG